MASNDAKNTCFICLIFKALKPEEKNKLSRILRTR